LTKSQNQLLRLNQALALCGICSRRKADKLIAQGLVKVNGEINTQFNTFVDLKRDQLTVWGKKVSSHQYEYVLLYKPKGVLSTCHDERNRNSLPDLLPSQLKHLKPVGRLDRDSAGLILMTNDGGLAQRLIHPSAKVLKTYHVTIAGSLTINILTQLKKGLELSDGWAKPKDARLLFSEKTQSCIEMTLAEGRNRQVRRMCSQLGLRVLSLVRVSLGELKLSGLKPGEWRSLSKDEVKSLWRSLAE
jgi:pseudouridine synthase